MITKKFLEQHKFELHSRVYEKRFAKRSFINVEFLDNLVYVELEVNCSAVSLPHIKSDKQIAELYLALTGNHL